MKFLFYSSHNDNTVGSHRIWVRDLCNYFVDIGIDAKIAIGELPDLSEYDVIIFGKGEHRKAVEVKNLHPDKKIGVINLASDLTGLNVDFLIVGSIEEMASHSTYPNVFIFPLIERTYQNLSSFKDHTMSNKLTIGFHGNVTHTSKFTNGLSRALDKASEIIPLEFVIITSAQVDSSFLPSKVEVKTHPWVEDEIIDRILSFDIGVVPNARIKGVDDESPSHGLFSTDYLMRFKNKSNAGRAFVYHQLGIPVIADITPSHFHVMAKPDCGYLVANDVGWYKAIVKLADFKNRQQIANNAKVEFDRLYNPYDWANRLLTNIRELK